MKFESAGAANPSSSQSGLVSALAPAKINLALHVTGRRDNGYHELETLVAFASVGDRVNVAPSGDDSHEIIGPGAEHLDAHPQNLEILARDALRGRFGEKACPPVAIRLEKHLPIASGVGGGSADAAATLLALSQLWQLPLGPDDDELRQIALSIGADVPMCLRSEPLLATGIGEAVETLQDWPVMAIVLVNPNERVATSAVFADLALRLDGRLPPIPSPPNMTAIIDWLQQTRNDLQPAAMVLTPSIADALSELDREHPLFLRMSGSGATCFGIFEALQDAEAAAMAIAERRPGWYVRAARTIADRNEVKLT